MNNQSASMGLTIAGHPVEIVNHDGRPYVSVTDIARGLGVDTAGQLRTIRNHTHLSRGLHETGSSKFLRAYLRFDLVTAWLAGMSTGRISTEAAAALQQFLDDVDALNQKMLERSFGNHPAEQALREQRNITVQVAELEVAIGLDKLTMKKLQASIREKQRAMANLHERLYITMDITRAPVVLPEGKKGGRK